MALKRRATRSEEIPSERPTRPTPNPPVAAFVAFVLLLGGATAAIFLAGGAEQGNLGVFLLCAGAALLIGVPRAKVSWGTGLVACLFLGCSALALLPTRWFHAPLWRQRLTAVPDLDLPGTISAVPAQTVFWLAVLGVTVLVGLFTLTQPVRSRGLLALALAAVSMCGVYAALSIFAKLSGWTYPFSGGATFGFLPNRNHTATLLITGSLVSIGILGVAFRERRWLAVDLAVAALLLCVTGLCFFSESRAGVVFLCLGTVGWLAGLGGQHRRGPLLLAVSIVVLVGGGLFLAVKSDARDRLLISVATASADQQTSATTSAAAPASRPGGDLSSDDRLRIYHDTFDLIRDAPLTGTGLGTFASVFAPYRQKSASLTRVLHPESDWLMVAAETGLPALVCLGLLVGLILRGWRPARAHPYWPLRWAFLVAAGAAAAHGLVDVPAHRAAVGWWVLVLAGVALQPGRAGDPAFPASKNHRRWAARTVFIVGGIAALVLGGALVRAEWFGGTPLPPFVAKHEQTEIVRTFDRGDVDEALAQARRAVVATPLSDPLYYQLGVLLMRFEDTDPAADRALREETDRAFLVQRLLSPWSPDISHAQGTAWLPIDPTRAATLYIDALARLERLPQNSLGKVSSAPYLRDLVAQAAGSPPAERLLWGAASARGPAWILGWLESADPTSTQERLTELASDEPFLLSLSPDERQRFVAVWKSKGDPKNLPAFLAGRGKVWQSTR